ncbi:MAG: flagellar filament capping protein FliD [Oscillospiraceae bacterium]|nr:flagellar filament capping protein FliD [Oscillospiraceae bacterium]
MAVSNIRLGGITSGFDTESMVTQLLSSYQTRIDNQNKKITKLSWQQSAYQDITKKITEFKNTYFDILKRDTYLMSASTFNKFKADVTSSSAADAAGLTVSTSSNSTAGSYKVKLTQAAKAASAKGSSVASGNFSLDLDKALNSATGEVKTNADGSKTWSMNFALDIQVGGAKKTISFTADAVLGADGNIADKDAAKSSIIDSLNAKLQESFGYSGKTTGATGATDANGKEWFLQAKMGADGKVEFQVGGNSSVTVTENKGNFGLAQPREKTAISTGSVVTGMNIFQVDIGGKTVSAAFNGVSSTYYDSKDQAGNEAVLAEFKNLKTAAYRKSYNLADDAVVTDEQLEKFTYSGAQAAKDRNAASIQEALKLNVKDYTFSFDGTYLTAADSNGNAVDFSMTSVEGGTLGLAKASASNKFNTSSRLSDLGFTAEADGTYKLNINGTEISLDKESTITSMISAVNKSAAGVTMTYSSLTNSFTLESKEFGSAGKIEVGDTALGRSLGLVDDNGTVGAAEGQNAIFEINGQEIYLNDNTYTLDGNTFTFNDNMTIGETYNVNITKDSTTVKEALKKFVESYNKLIDDVYGYIGKSPATDDDGNKYEPLTSAEKEEMSEDEITKWEEKAKQGVLYNDSTVSTVMSQMRSALYTSVTLDDGSKFGIYNLGIKTSSEWSQHGKLEIDEDAFDKAFEKNEDAIIKLFTDSDSGMMKKLNSVIDNAVKSSGAANTRGTLVRKAGKANSSVTTDSTIYKEMVKMQDRLKELQDRYDSKEEYWWKVFTNMETAMTDLNSQTSYISSYLGTGSTNYQ